MKHFKTKHGDILLDDEDYERLTNQLQSCVLIATTVKGEVVPIRLRNKEKVTITLASFLLNKKGIFYYKDGNVLNNQKDNIVEGKKSKLKYKGVSQSSVKGQSSVKMDSYRAYLVIDGAMLTIGMYKTEILAAIAYNKGLDLLGKNSSYERNVLDLPKAVYVNMYESIVVDVVKRTSTQGLNRKNKNCTSIYTGVCFKPGGLKSPWIVKITFNWLDIHIGSYQNEVIAAQAYNEVALYLHGKEAKLNPVPRTIDKIVDLVKIEDRILKQKQKRLVK